MPAHSYENMPEVMRRRFTPADGIDRTPSEDSKLRTWNASPGVGGAARAAFNERLDRQTMLPNRFLSDLSKRAQVCLRNTAIWCLQESIILLYENIIL